MAKRQGNRLAALQIPKLVKKPGIYADGHGLWLDTRGGRCAWKFRYSVNSKPGFSRWVGLGPLHTVSLAEARERARQQRQLILDGKDPLAVKQEAVAAAKVAAASTKTFAYCVAEFLKTPRMVQFKNDKHRAQWRSTLQMAVDSFGSLPMRQITSAVILECLKPIMEKTPETGTRLRGRIERVFEWAKPPNYFEGDNPASWQALKDHLPEKPTAIHHKALPYADLPDFMARLDLGTAGPISAKALAFAILTAARTAETIGAKWSEIDLKAATWTIGAERMKAGKAHIVPLSDRAVAILNAVTNRNRVGDHVFRNGGGRPISNMAMAELLKGMGVDCTVHGFRSCFSDWAHDRTGFAPDVIEHALAHTIKNKTAAAYRRDTALDKRVLLMDAWARYCEGQGVANGEVVPIRA